MAQLYWASDQEYVLEYNKQPIVRAGEKKASGSRRALFTIKNTSTG